MSSHGSSVTRRAFLHRSLAALAGASAAGLPALRAPAQTGDKKRRPNVILIYSDDQGSIDLGCYGAKDLHTPNLDALAARGVRMTQWYAPSSVCSPSRAGLMTGRYPHRAQLPNNAPSIPGKDGMPTEQITMAEVFRQAGYRTALFGKWHLGTSERCQPNAQGFDEAFGHLGGCIDNYSHFFYWHGPNRHDLYRDGKEVFEDGTHIGDLIVREAKRFLDANKDRPFFLYLPFNMPHYPTQAKVEDRQRFADMPEPRRSYAAFLATLDRQIGQVLDEVDRLKLRENTVILFIADQGHSREERTNFGGGSAGPYRGCKFSLFEGGIRVPAIVSMPGVIPQGEVRSQWGGSIDVLPTLVDLCGLDKPAHRIDGLSVAEMLKSASADSPHRVMHWQLGNQWAVREGDWKLVANAQDPLGADRPADLPKPDKIFLSNLAQDVTETKNQAAENGEIVKRLTRLHEHWAKDVQEQ
ncbi:MAG: Arylsulfatase [Planctomycetes bacterium ADurb.Bin126]|mgnify:CR=1 FL=1|nr:MAG: Arylsulfatase [Planctomycetes bacterium ADurb.Bin126]HOD82429.1 sulfatase-like hydrolase/transferase [Phycisphaerae bacterium]